MDLIAYEITQLEPLELKELTDATGAPPILPSIIRTLIEAGGLAGSLMLNRRFEDWVKSVVGDRAYLDLVEHPSYRQAMKTFDENIKPAFRSKEDEEQYVPFPKANLNDDPAKGLKNNMITVDG